MFNVVLNHAAVWVLFRGELGLDHSCSLLSTHTVCASDSLNHYFESMCTLVQQSIYMYSGKICQGV